MPDKSDPISMGKWARALPETERLLKQFCRYESSVDAKTFDLRHLYMEPCANVACGPMHLTDAERAQVAGFMGEAGFEEAILRVLGGRGGTR